LYVTEEILAECQNVLQRPRFDIPKGRRRQLLQLIRNRVRSVPPARTPQVASVPDDNIFLECADAARTDYLVTGIRGIFRNSGRKTKLITSRKFISVVAPHLIL
jgi:predicted nucleic acid-binding protein